jgi:hypothetical protein
MRRRSFIRRGMFAAFITAAFAVAAPAGIAGAADEVPAEVCDYDWQEGRWHVKRLIKCAARRWDSPGSPDLAVGVARCESNLSPSAYNPDGGYAGLFQHARRYWPGRADRWGQPDRSVFNGRANVIVSIRMAAALGSWDAWAGCG